MSSVLEIPERQTTGLCEADYRELEESSTVLDLMAAGVVTLLRSKKIPFGIRAGPFVGDAVLESGTRLRLTPKVNGAVGQLIQWSLPDDVRVLATPSLVGPDATTLDHFARRFVDLLGVYLSRGRIKEYMPTPSSLVSPRGRVDVAGTVRVRSRGQTRSVHSLVRVLKADIPLNRLLEAGLWAAEAALQHDGERLAAARSYARLLEDVDGQSVSRLGWEGRSQAFDGGMRDPRAEGTTRQALAFARILVLHGGAWPSEPHGEAPESFFLNLETLFEEAVRQVLAGQLRVCEVGLGRDVNRPLFTDLPDQYIADPDVAILRGSRSPVLVDCKYKDLETDPGHSDVYQLIAHCGAFGASEAVLVYPGADFGVRCLGTTGDGVRLLVCQVRLDNLAADLGVLAAELGLA